MFLGNLNITCFLYYSMVLKMDNCCIFAWFLYYILYHILCLSKHVVLQCVTQYVVLNCLLQLYGGGEGGEENCQDIFLRGVAVYKGFFNFLVVGLEMRTFFQAFLAICY
eukprot:TRINITY_DN4629_c0_g2_i1.p3 TRINITY_DN4629_c0_g2~~TRINITY_DN4629_c0_g2_i1.p3  ORF type:complete len:109 (+),score=8.45 TRINITY_DN4629_c0_g2_i1:119-445(+)